MNNNILDFTAEQKRRQQQGALKPSNDTLEEVLKGIKNVDKDTKEFRYFKNLTHFVIDDLRDRGYTIEVVRKPVGIEYIITWPRQVRYAN